MLFPLSNRTLMNLILIQILWSSEVPLVSSSYPIIRLLSLSSVLCLSSSFLSVFCPLSSARWHPLSWYSFLSAGQPVDQEPRNEALSPYPRRMSLSHQIPKGSSGGSGQSVRHPLRPPEEPGEERTTISLAPRARSS